MDGTLIARSDCRCAVLIRTSAGRFVFAGRHFAPTFQLLAHRHWPGDYEALALVRSLGEGALAAVLELAPEEIVGVADDPRDLQPRLQRRLLDHHIKVYRPPPGPSIRTLLTNLRRVELLQGPDPADASLEQLQGAILMEMSRLLAERGATRESWDRVYRAEPWYQRWAIAAGAATAGLLDTAKGLGESASAVVEVGGDLAQGLAGAVAVQLQIQRHLLRGDSTALEAQVKALGGQLRRGADDLVELLQQGKRILEALLADPRFGLSLAQYGLAWVSATPRVAQWRGSFRLGGDVLVALALAAASGGAGAAAGAANLARHAGLFSDRLLALLGRAYRLRQRMAAPPAAIPPPRANVFRDLPPKPLPSPGPVATPAPNAGAPAVSAGPPATGQAGRNRSGDPTPANPRTGGEPISLVTGEEILTLTDFTLPGVLPLAWERHYRSSNPDDSGLGHGWTHSFDERLERAGDEVHYHTADARRVSFPLPAVGGEAINRFERLRLHRSGPDQYHLSASDGPAPRRHFAPLGDGSLRLGAVRDALGNGVALVYAEGRLQALVASHGARWELHYDDTGHLRAVRQPRSDGHRTRVSYQIDAHGDLIRATDPAGHAEHYAYHHHFITCRTLKSGYRFHFQWDGEHAGARCLRNWGDPIDGQPTYDYRFAWDKANRRVTVTDTRGGREHYTFNAAGLPLRHRDAEGGETRYHYDADGQLLRVVDPLGHERRFSRDRHGRVHHSRDADGSQTRLRHDAQGNPIERIDPLGQRWQRRYDSAGQLVEQIDPLGACTRYQYNALGLVSAVINPLGESWRYLWDAQGPPHCPAQPAGPAHPLPLR